MRNDVVAGQARAELIAELTKLLSDISWAPALGGSEVDETRNQYAQWLKLRGKDLLAGLGETPQELDNHHNALLCAYCNPKGLTFAEAETVPSSQTAWLPIATAPLKTRVLVTDGVNVWLSHAQVSWSPQLKGWQPLPAAPVLPAQEPPKSSQTAWQPIATAPKDGRKILLLTKLGRMVIAVWFPGSFLVNGDWTCEGTNAIVNPTHWAPLPAAPALPAQEPPREGGGATLNQGIDVFATNIPASPTTDETP